MKYLPLILLLFGFGCSVFESNDKNKPDDVLMPLAVGNWWEYEIIRPGWENPHQGTVRESVSEQIEVSVDGENYLAWGWNSEIDRGSYPEFKWLNRNGEGGLYALGGIAETDTIFRNILAYKYPSTIGESWKYHQALFSMSNFKFYVSDTLKITLLDNNRAIETPAGKFKCHVYYFQISMGYDVPGYFGYYIYYKPGIGLIAQEEWGEYENRPDSNNLLSKIVLIDYHLVR